MKPTERIPFPSPGIKHNCSGDQQELRSKGLCVCVQIVSCQMKHKRVLHIKKIKKVFAHDFFSIKKIKFEKCIFMSLKTKYSQKKSI